MFSNSRPNLRTRTQARPRLETLEGRQLMSLGSEFQVNTTTSGAQFDADNASSAGGASVAVWTDFSSSSDHVVRAQRYDRFQNKVGPEIVVAHIGGSSAAGTPSVAMGPAGNFVVTWTQTGTGSDTNVLARQYNSAGGAVGGIVQVGVGTFRERDPDAAIDASGRFVISYTRDTNNNNPDVFAKRYDSGGNLLNVLNVGVSSKAENRSSVAVTPDGRISVAYEFQFSSTDDDIFMNRFSSAGASLGTIGITNSSAREKAPSVAVDNLGNAVVAYQKFVGSDFDIKARRVSFAGFAGGEINIRNTTAEETAPSVALKRGGGGFVVAYNSSSQVRVTEVSSSDTVLSTFDAGSSRNGPAVSIDGLNRYLVTYTATQIRPFPFLIDRNIRGRFGRLS